MPPEDAELADIIDALKNPDALTVPELIAEATGDAAVWLMNRGNRRSLPHRLERCGYTAVPNSDAQDRLWKCKSRRLAIYVRADLPPGKRIAAAEKKARS